MCVAKLFGYLSDESGKGIRGEQSGNRCDRTVTFLSSNSARDMFCSYPTGMST